MQEKTSNEFICDAIGKYSDVVLRISFLHTQNSADAEDVTQETFLALLDASFFNNETHLKAWLIRVAINKCKDLKKSAAKRKTVKLDESAQKYSFDNEDIGVIEKISRLRPIDRHIVVLHYFEGYSAKEVGDIVGKNEAAVFTRLKRIRTKLKEMLEEEQ